MCAKTMTLIFLRRYEIPVPVLEHDKEFPIPGNYACRKNAGLLQLPLPGAEGFLLCIIVGSFPQVQAYYCP
jgi:hypothetical protein